MKHHLEGIIMPKTSIPLERLGDEVDDRLLVAREVIGKYMRGDFSGPSLFDLESIEVMPDELVEVGATHE